MYISLDVLVKVLTALSVAAGLITLCVTAIKRKANEDAKLKSLQEDVVRQKEESANVRRSCHEEQTLIIFGLLACLKGLQEQGCNGPVTVAVQKIEKHLNIKAHE